MQEASEAKGHSMQQRGCVSLMQASKRVGVGGVGRAGVHLSKALMPGLGLGHAGGAYQ